MRVLSLILVLCLCAPAVADQKVYKTVGPNGEVTFSDTPTPGATELDVKPAPSYKAPPLPTPSTTPADQSAGQPGQHQAGGSYKLVSILAPADDATVINTPGDVQVTVLVEPPLRTGRGDRIRLLLDGKAVDTGEKPNFSLHNVDRGTHHLQAEVIDRSGATLSQSSSSTFHLHRPSVHLPGHQKAKPAPKPKPKP